MNPLSRAWVCFAEGQPPPGPPLLENNFVFYGGVVLAALLLLGAYLWLRGARRPPAGPGPGEGP